MYNSNSLSIVPCYPCTSIMQLAMALIKYAYQGTCYSVDFVEGISVR